MDSLLRVPVGRFVSALSRADHVRLGFNSRAQFLAASLVRLGELELPMQKACWVLSDFIVPLAKDLGTAHQAQGAAQTAQLEQVETLLEALLAEGLWGEVWQSQVLAAYLDLVEHFAALGNEELTLLVLRGRIRAANTYDFEQEGTYDRFCQALLSSLARARDLAPGVADRLVRAVVLGPEVDNGLTRIYPAIRVLDHLFGTGKKALLGPAIQLVNQGPVLQLVDDESNRIPGRWVLSWFRQGCSLDTHRFFVQRILCARLPSVPGIMQNIETRIFDLLRFISNERSRGRSPVNLESELRYFYQAGSIWVKHFLVNIDVAPQIHGRRHEHNKSILLALQNLEGAKQNILEFLLPKEDATRLARLKAPTGYPGWKCKRVKPN